MKKELEFSNDYIAIRSIEYPDISIKCSHFNVEGMYPTKIQCPVPVYYSFINKYLKYPYSEIKATLDFKSVLGVVNVDALSINVLKDKHNIYKIVFKDDLAEYVLLQASIFKVCAFNNGVYIGYYLFDDSVFDFDKVVLVTRLD